MGDVKDTALQYAGKAKDFIQDKTSDISMSDVKDTAMDYAKKAKDFVQDKTSGISTDKITQKAKEMVPAVVGSSFLSGEQQVKGSSGKEIDDAFQQTSDFMRLEDQARQYALAQHSGSGAAKNITTEKASKAAGKAKDFVKDKASQIADKDQGITDQVVGTVKSGANWVSDKAAAVIPSTSTLSSGASKVADTASSAVDWVKDKVGFGGNNESNDDS